MFFLKNVLPLRIHNEWLHSLSAFLPPSSVFLDNEPLPYHDSTLTGSLRYKKIMQSRNPHRFLDEYRMNKPTFKRLLRKLMFQGGLENLSAGAN